MTNTATSNVEKTVKQIKRLEDAGCEIIRVGVPDIESAKAIGKIKKQIKIPLVADIHFSATLAIEAIKQRVDKIRINPGNFPKQELVKIVTLCKKNKIPIRIGINSGSLEKDILGKNKFVTPEMMVKSAIRNVELLEKMKFYDIVVSLKAPDVLRTVKAYEMLSEKINYPLHLGVTEAGGEFSGTVKSSIALGSLLLNGIGDTIRISLSSDPVAEVRAGWEILKSLDLRQRGVKIVSCPTCARTSIDVIGLSKKIEQSTEKIKKPVKVAIMGCVVNGLGEGREADLAIVGGGRNIAMIIKRGEIIKRIEKEKAFNFFKKELKKII